MTNTTEKFFAEVDTLYNSRDKARREQADSWLQAFQKTSEAWAISNQVLRSPQLTPESEAARHFAAELLYQYRSGPRLIVTQLCLSLACLALQMPEWQNVLHQFTELYGKNQETVNCLLEFLKVLPEEINTNNRIPILDEDYRVRSKQLLTDNSNEVLQILLVYLQNSGTNTDYQKKVFECFHSWLQSGDIAISSLKNNPFLGLSFDALQSDDLYDIAVDVVCEIIFETQEIPESMPVIEQIYPRLLPLREALKRAMDEDNEDRVRGYCRIFTHAGESYLDLIVQHADDFRSIVESIVECTAYHDTEIVRITFYFWHRLADTLYQPRHANIKDKFKDIYSNLVDIMIKHLHYPKDLTTWSAEKRDEFREFRHVMGDVLKDSCLISGSAECLSKPFTTLARQLANSVNGTVDWQEIEAPLFSLRAMGSEVEDEEDVYLPQIMQLLQQLPDHPKIRYAATLVISRYSYWTRHHPQFIPYQLNFISSGFDNEEVSAAAALALKYLCKDCSELLIEYLPQLHHFYFNVTNTLHGIDLFEVTEAVSHVVAAVRPAELLEALQMFCLPIARYLHEFANKGSAATDKEIRDACGEQLSSDKLEQFSIIIRVIADSRKETNTIDVNSGLVHPCITIIKDLWPVFDLLLVQFGSDSHLSEILCKCFKYCVVFYRISFRPLLPDLMERLVTVFGQTHLSCYLWVATKCVQEYSDDEGTEMTMAMISFVERLSVTMFSLLNGKKSAEIPDVIEDYFRLNIALFESTPITFSQSAVFLSVFQAGLTCLTIQQHDALFSIIVFFHKLLNFRANPKQKQKQKHSPGTPTVPITSTSATEATLNAALSIHDSLWKQYVTSFLENIFKGLMYTFPRDIQHIEIHEILMFLSKIYPLECQQRISEIIQNIQDSNLTSEAKNGFIRDYNSAIRGQDWSRLRRISNDFIAVFRRRYLASRQRRDNE
ncbi:14524_t:CDS:2 [Funneliformis caledonium]|uniref:14524_t:CDS:1 n=1 Tax=Funneliformis caledonium TaxID=1117310 RepID=A0A9N9BYG0_9GLOM|nr:14524_t:CDS:2 [Funneliformis caledonium]